MHHHDPHNLGCREDAYLHNDAHCHDHLIDPCHDHGAPLCDDQIPVWSTVGQGIQGDSYRVDIQDPDSTDETHLYGKWFDASTGTWIPDWTSENINGGELKYQYNLRPYTIPRTFTMTFMYRRPGRPEWSWTTPAIPYIWTLDPAGRPDTDPDHIVGSGIATLFTKTGVEDKYPWVEKLIYPDGTTREDFNAPEQGGGWTSNLLFGVDGDIECPNIEDLANIEGWPEDKLRDAANKVNNGPISGDPDIKTYIDRLNRETNEYITQAVTNIWNHLRVVTPSGEAADLLDMFRQPPISIKQYRADFKTPPTTTDDDEHCWGVAARYEYHEASWLVIVKVAGYCTYGANSLELFKVPENLAPVREVIVPCGPNTYVVIAESGDVALRTYNGNRFNQGTNSREMCWGTATYYASAFSLNEGNTITDEEHNEWVKQLERYYRLRATFNESVGNNLQSTAWLQAAQQRDLINSNRANWTAEQFKAENDAFEEYIQIAQEG